MAYKRYKTHNDEGYICITNMADECGVMIKYLHLIYPPKHTRGKKKYYLASEVGACKKAIAVWRSKARDHQEQKNRWKPEGLWNQTNAAKYLGVPVITFKSWVIKKQIPAPSIVGVGRYLYYSLADLKAIRKMKKDYFENYPSKS